MENDGTLKRKDTTKGPPLRILSLDGGGVRGYSMIIILQELMHRTYVEIEGKAPRRAEIPKPCDHFDLIVGTGTGGLIALMLGRLRLDLEQCKELYVRMTRMVFETDKTFAGIPFRHTLFKASMLEQAIKEAVREHTVDEQEGNDGSPSSVVSPLSATARSGASGSVRRHQSNASVVSFSARSPTAQMARPVFRAGYGDPDAKLYDSRENRTKTAVTAVYKGTPVDRKTGRGLSPPAMLRSYDSRKEPAPEYDCTVWEAGRATSAIELAFKPIKIGQSLFLDDGAGSFNPAPEALDEATVNEWPGREVGVFISIGTGKRPKSAGPSSQEEIMKHFMPYHVEEGRKKIVLKIEGCEKIHEEMKKEYLMRRGVNVENYYRLNVEMGVGEFGMNEWHRLSEISTGTRRYMSRPDEQRMIQESSTKLAKIHRAKLRYDKMSNVPEIVSSAPLNSISSPLAVELPGDFPPMFPMHNTPPSRQSYDSGTDRLSLPGSNAGQGPNTPSPRSSGERSRPATGGASPGPPPAKPLFHKPSSQAPLSSVAEKPLPDEPDRFVVNAPTPAQYRTASGADKIFITGSDELPRKQNQQVAAKLQPRIHRIEPPPLPPKTPLLENQAGRRPGTTGSQPPPYPLDDDAPPPAVNWSGKPRGR
ncbi:acyl transferase/acyl hydrolase/lysophospholipase [Pseudomassariella vexata]|uniref:Acyl transferase/acyl hydrolase/lysophospholipase n=1 Tax=Pseudomassariella vexata TaxID=1141098 RepID=A0A1Y2DDA5_9PEZI|nr:acyl transferase/acyl hydrolase/lysophospholipase [Pseudomassariella vexata]ORY57263.1 acyl transferase/acyl hydrolase/lysophospholipase [Pseudomassariella vexata]